MPCIEIKLSFSVYESQVYFNFSTFSFAKNKITYFKGAGEITAKGEVAVKGDKKEIIKTKNIIIATGSSVTDLPGVKIDGKDIVSSDHAIHLKAVTKLIY